MAQYCIIVYLVLNLFTYATMKIINIVVSIIRLIRLKSDVPLKMLGTISWYS